MTVRKTDMLWRKIARTFMHPLQYSLLLEVWKGEPVSPNQLAEKLGVPLGNASYHMKVLADKKLIRLKEEKPVRGTVEHFYVLGSARHWKQP